MRAIQKISLVIVLAVLLVCVWVVLIPQTSRADGPWYVTPSGNDSYDCLSPGTPCATMSTALFKASSGDMIYVATGTYTDKTAVANEVVLIDKSITLSGGWDETFTVQNGLSTIDGEGKRGGIKVNNGIVTIEGFILQNGYYGGLDNDSGETILRNSIIKDNIGGAGGLSNSGSIELHYVLVFNNKDDGGYGAGGITNGGSMELHNVSIIKNDGNQSEAGGIFNTGTLILNNSTVSGNVTKNTGGGIYNDTIYSGDTSTVSINNSTITENSANEGGGIYQNGNSVIIQNSILAGNTGNDGPECWGTIGSLGYNLFEDTTGCTFTPSTGDLTGLDPLLGQLIGEPGYHPLLLGSPAIDAGNPTGCKDGQGNPLASDQRGAARVGRCDIGAFEYTTPGPAARISVHSGSPQRTPPLFDFDIPIQALVVDDIGSPVKNINVSFAAPSSGPSGTFVNSAERTTSGLTNESGVVDAGIFTANNIAGTYTITAQATGIISPTEYQMTNIAWYVTTSGDDNNDCNTPSTPCASVNGVLNKLGFIAGDTILIAEGTYTGNGSEVVFLDKDVTIYGGWDATFTEQSGTTAIDGENTRRGITVEGDRTTYISNISVQKGQSDSGGAILSSGRLTLSDCFLSGNTSEGSGGGIRHGGGPLKINNCTVSNNTSHDGGGIDAGNVVVNNSTIRNNSAYFGGGIHVSSGCILYLNNTTVTNNEADVGGGIYVTNAEEVTINNSTIFSNTAEYGGGISMGYSDEIKMQNSILSGNSGGDAPDCYGTIDSGGYNLFGDISNWDCIITPTTGDLIGTNPKILPSLTGLPGYYPLLPSSPAIDAGNPTGCTDHVGKPLTIDQRGTARPLDGDGDSTPVCDIGSYEFDPDNPTGEIFMPLVARNLCSNFFDDFSDPTSGWDVVDNEYEHTEYLNGEYRVLSKQTGYVYSYRAPTCSRENYVIEVDARWASTPGGSYGILFGTLADYSQYYLFEVDTDYQDFSVWQRVPGGWSQIVPWTYSSAISSGNTSNHLKVTRDGVQITLEVNGVVLGMWSDDKLIGLTYAGIMTDIYNDYPPYDARFDNFSVKILPGSGMPLQSGHASPTFTSSADLSIKNHHVAPAPEAR